MNLAASFSVPMETLRSLWIVAALSFIVASHPAAAQPLEQRVDALAKQLVEADPYYQKEEFRALSATTQNLIRAIDEKRAAITLFKGLVNELKREPSLTVEQLRWLVEIEDLFVDADGSYASGRAMYALADLGLFVGESPEAKLEHHFAGQKRVSEASRKNAKARRDLVTLWTRVEIQKSRN